MKLRSFRRLGSSIKEPKTCFRQTMRKIFVIDSAFSAQKELIGGDYYFSYNFPKEYSFAEPHFARLLWFYSTNLKTPFYLCVDFIEFQVINNERLPFLACTGEGFDTFWSPLARNFIPSSGFIRLKPHSTTAFPKKEANITVAIEIAPQSWIYGTSS